MAGSELYLAGLASGLLLVLSMWELRGLFPRRRAQQHAETPNCGGRCLNCPASGECRWEATLDTYPEGRAAQSVRETLAA